MNIARTKVSVTVGEVTREVPLVTLVAWKGALRLEMVGLRHSKQNASTVIRRMFCLHRSVKREQLLEFVVNVLDEVGAMMEAKREQA